VILQSANHFKVLYDLLLRLEDAVRAPAPATDEPSLTSAMTFSTLGDLVPPEARVIQLLDTIDKSATEVDLLRTLSRVEHFKNYILTVGASLSMDDPRTKYELGSLREALDDDLHERFVFFPDMTKLDFVFKMGGRFNFN
jgi:hypothetical protein